MFSLGQKQDGVVYGAIIDVGSGSVGVGIVESNPKKKTPVVLYAHRELMRVGTGAVSREDKIRQMREALFSACLTLSNEGLLALAAEKKGAQISKVLVTCSSPWAHTVARNVSYSSDETFKVTPSLIQNLVKDAESEIESTHDETNMVGKLGLQIVERATVNIRINGYSVHSTTGLKGKELELYHIIGLVPDEVLDAISEVQEKVLVGTERTAHTYMLVNYCVLRELFADVNTMSIIDVTGESTEIGIVEDDILYEVGYAPYGSHTLLREIAQGPESSAEHALSILRGYAEGTLSDKEQRDVEDKLKPFTESMTAAIQKIHENRRIPHVMIVSALDELEAFFKSAILKIVSQATNKDCVILEFNQERTTDVPGTAETDKFISLASRFFHKLHGCGEIDTL